MTNKSFRIISVNIELSTGAFVEISPFGWTALEQNQPWREVTIDDNGEIDLIRRDFNEAFGSWG